MTADLVSRALTRISSKSVLTGVSSLAFVCLCSTGAQAADTGPISGDYTFSENSTITMPAGSDTTGLEVSVGQSVGLQGGVTPDLTITSDRAANDPGGSIGISVTGTGQVDLTGASSLTITGPMHNAIKIMDGGTVRLGNDVTIDLSAVTGILVTAVELNADGVGGASHLVIGDNLDVKTNGQGLRAYNGARLEVGNDAIIESTQNRGIVISSHSDRDMSEAVIGNGLKVNSFGDGVTAAEHSKITIGDRAIITSQDHDGVVAFGTLLMSDGDVAGVVEIGDGATITAKNNALYSYWGGTIGVGDNAKLTTTDNNTVHASLNNATIRIGNDVEIRTNHIGLYAEQSARIYVGEGADIKTNGSGGAFFAVGATTNEAQIHIGQNATLEASQIVVTAQQTAKVTIDAGATINATNSASSYAIYARDNGSIDLKGATITTTGGNRKYALATDFGGEIKADGLFNIKGSLYAQNNSDINLTMQSGSTLEGYSFKSADSRVNIAMDQSRWLMTNNSQVTRLDMTNGSILDASYWAFSTKTLTGEVNSVASTIDMVGTKSTTSENYIMTLVINGNYTATSVGGVDSKLIVNTIWNDPDTSLSDRLRIKGTAAGRTQVSTKDGIIGNVTVAEGEEKYSANVVTVDNHTMGANAFYGFADTVGAGQALLKQVDASNYAWYLGPSGPGPGPGPINPTRPEVPGYTLMPTVNMEMGYMALGTLHERVSEHQIMAWENSGLYQLQENKAQGWGRVFGGYTNLNGAQRYGFDLDTFGMQAGYDLDIDYDAENKVRRHTGIMLTLMHGWSMFSDRNFVSFDLEAGDYVSSKGDTGSGKTMMVGLGAYNTFYFDNGAYIDTLGNLTYSHNKYDSKRTRDGGISADNDAFGVGFSLEGGYPIAINDNWFVEPQAQLVYQYQSYTSFDDDILKKFDSNLDVDQRDNHGLRGRLGGRVVYKNFNEDGRANTVYMTANVVHDFIEPKSVSIGTSSVREDQQDLWAQFGLGLQVPLPTEFSSYVYADARVDHSLSNRDDGQRQSYRATVGFKYNW